MPKRTDISSILIIATAALTSFACTTRGINSNATIAAQRAEARRVATICGLPAKTLIVRDNGTMRLRPKPTESYQKVDCALSELRKSGLLQQLPTDFVGNERVDENMQ